MLLNAKMILTFLCMIKIINIMLTVELSLKKVYNCRASFELHVRKGFLRLDFFCFLVAYLLDNWVKTKIE